MEALGKRPQKEVPANLWPGSRASWIIVLKEKLASLLPAAVVKKSHLCLQTENNHTFHARWCMESTCHVWLEMCVRSWSFIFFGGKINKGNSGQEYALFCSQVLALLPNRQIWLTPCLSWWQNADKELVNTSKLLSFFPKADTHTRLSSFVHSIWKTYSILSNRFRRFPSEL